MFPTIGWSCNLYSKENSSKPSNKRKLFHACNLFTCFIACSSSHLNMIQGTLLQLGKAPLSVDLAICFSPCKVINYICKSIVPNNVHSQTCGII
jgi:hypothetical protein